MNGTRRAVLAALAASPFLAHAADTRVRRIASLCVGRIEPMRDALAAFGWEAGRNLQLEWRQVARYGPVEERNRAALDLLATRPELVTAETGACARAIVDAAPAMPVVAAVWDPVIEGFARTIARPGGSVTGLSFEAPRNFIVMLETLRMMLPGLRRMHSLATAPFHHDRAFAWVREEAARALGIEIAMHDVGSNEEAAQALRQVGHRRREAVYLFRTPGIDAVDVVRRALELRIALTYIEARSGALLACNYQHVDSLRTLASLADKILHGASPATLPFEMPTRLQLDINRATARALGIEIPAELLVRATALHG